MKIKSIREIKNLKGKRVFLKLDINVPVKAGKVKDDFKILKSLPTIQYLLNKGAKLLIVSHLGRPKRVDNALSMRPVGVYLEKLLKTPVKFFSVGTKEFNTEKYLAKVGKAFDGAKAGQVLLFDNIRFFPEERNNSQHFSRALASLADIFVSDCFAVVHHPAPSVNGAAAFLPSYAGFLTDEEIAGLTKVTEKPKKPLVVVIGGAKTETKIPVIKNLLTKADYVLIAGGVVNTYLWAKGYQVGSSLIEKEFKKEVLKYCSNKKVIRPVDFVVGNKDGSKAHVVQVDKKFGVKDKKMALYDVGPKTVQLFSKYIKLAQTLIWNGPMGFFEVHPYQYGTYALAHLFAARSKGKAFGVIGGGETVQVFEKLGLAKDVDLVSTGGGAMLEFLSGKKLPGLTVLSMPGK